MLEMKEKQTLILQPLGAGISLHFVLRHCCFVTANGRAPKIQLKSWHGIFSTSKRSWCLSADFGVAFFFIMATLIRGGEVDCSYSSPPPQMTSVNLSDCIPLQEQLYLADLKRFYLISESNHFIFYFGTQFTYDPKQRER